MKSTRYNSIECHQETTDNTRMENSKRSVVKAKETAPTKRNARCHLPLPSFGLRSSGVYHGSWMPKAFSTAQRLVVLFDEKPNADEVFSEKLVPTRLDRDRHIKPRASTSTMPSFDLTSRFGKDFVHWLTSDWGGSKSAEQATQIARRVLKFLRFWYPDADSNWNITESAIGSSMACTRHLTEFIGCIRDQWQMGYPGTIAYINALGDAIDYRKSNGGFKA